MMLNLDIKSFKCFREADISLNNLTVFAGANGNGKSTTIQALLLLRRTIEHCAKWENNRFNMDELIGLNVELNGPYCLNLGNSAYIIAADSGADTIFLGISSGDNVFGVTYSINEGKELWITPIAPLTNKFTDNPLYYQEFYYLNAERIGPRLSQEIHFYDYYNVGHKGEYTAQIISDLNYDFKVDEKRVNKEFLLGSRFVHHVNAWLNYILSGVSIASHYDEKTHTAHVEIENSYSKGNPVTPTNTGFGISYVLPIIVSGLIAKADRFLIVENPEAHLHPSAQSKIGYFLGIIANSGVRVIVETHSDHVVNGIQLAVAKKAILNDAVTINFFIKMAENTEKIFKDPKVKSLHLRYFDPTISAALCHEDKGLIECLMVKCAKALIYTAGDKDSYGKDVEAAMALSSSKPVIFFCPNADKQDFFAKVHPLTRLVDFNNGVANGAMVTFDEQTVVKLLDRIFKNKMEYELTQLDGYFKLKDKLSDCTIRIQTSHSLLKKSFWNYYNKNILKK